MASLYCMLLVLLLLGSSSSSLLLPTSTTGTNSSLLRPSTVHIYSNLAEIIQDLGPLPLEFEEEEWKDMRPDSITLLGANVTSQTITEKKVSRNGQKVYIRSASSPSQGAPNIVQGILVDETRNLIKDPTIGKEGVFYTLPSEHIYDVRESPKSKFYVNFTYVNATTPRVSYLQDKLTWKTRYQLNLFGDEKNEAKFGQLIAFADIRNDGKVNISIQQAELIGGDSNIKMTTHRPSKSFEYGFSAARLESGSLATSAGSEERSSPPTVSEGKELAGLYVFSIDKGFFLEPKTNYLLAMFNVTLEVERPAIISKNFQASESKGKAQRFYRFVSDRFLSRGNCIVREDERLVGETDLSDLAAKDKAEFSVGEDPDVTFKSTVSLKSTRTYNETGIIFNGQTWRQRVENVHDVLIKFKNFKKREVKLVFEEKFPYFDKVTLEKNGGEGGFSQEGTTINVKKTLKPEERLEVAYTVKTLN